jgi:hypothetical protein
MTRDEMMTRFEAAGFIEMNDTLLAKRTHLGDVLEVQVTVDCQVRDQLHATGYICTKNGYYVYGCSEVYTSWDVSPVQVIQDVCKRLYDELAPVVKMLADTAVTGDL